MAKADDANVIIQTIQATFHTIDDDKDKGDGISEKILLDGNKIVGSNQSWGKDLTFHNNSTDLGQPFDISAQRVPAREVSRFTYSYDMDNDDGWNVVMHINITLQNGSKYEVAAPLLNIGNGHRRDGNIALNW